MAKCYLIVVVDTKTLAVLGAGTFSDWPVTSFGRTRFQLLADERYGENYHEANLAMLNAVATEEHLAWVRPLLRTR